MPRTAVSIDGIRGDQQHRGRRRRRASSLRQQRHAVLIGQVDVAQHEIEAAARRSRRSRRRRSRRPRPRGRRGRARRCTARGCRARRRRPGSRSSRGHHSASDAYDSEPLRTNFCTVDALGITTRNSAPRPFGSVADLDRAARGRDEVLAHREAEAGAGAGAFVVKNGSKTRARSPRRDAGAVVGDRDQRRDAAGRRRASRSRSAAAVAALDIACAAFCTRLTSTCWSACALDRDRRGRRDVGRERRARACAAAARAARRRGARSRGSDAPCRRPRRCRARARSRAARARTRAGRR